MSAKLRTKSIVVVGAKAAGKTCITHRLIEEPIDFTTYRPTIDDCYNITWDLSGTHSVSSIICMAFH